MKSINNLCLLKCGFPFFEEWICHKVVNSSFHFRGSRNYFWWFAYTCGFIRQVLMRSKRLLDIQNCSFFLSLNISMTTSSWHFEWLNFYLYFWGIWKDFILYPAFWLHFMYATRTLLNRKQPAVQWLKLVHRVSKQIIFSWETQKFRKSYLILSTFTSSFVFAHGWCLYSYFLSSSCSLK